MKLDKWIVPALTGLAVLFVAEPALAAEAAESYYGSLGMAAGIAIGVAAAGGAIGQGLASKGALEGIARNPQASAKILIPMVLGLALIESLVLYSLVIAYMLQGKIPGLEG